MAGICRILKSASRPLMVQKSFGQHLAHEHWLKGCYRRDFTSKISTGGDKKSDCTGGATKVEPLPIQYKFFAIGNVLLDHTARLPGNEIDVLRKFHIPENSKGELDVETLRKLKQDACKRVKCVESPGGSALNTMRILTQLGSNALFIGSAGNDDAGKTLRKYFKDHNINAHLFTYDDAPTGECMSIINKDTNAEVLYANLGASTMVSVDNMKKVEQELKFLRPPERRQIIYIEGFMLPHSAEVCHYVLKNYVSGHRWLALNLSAEFIVRQNYDLIMEFIDAAHFIFGNGIEFCALADKMGYGMNSEKAVQKIFEKRDVQRIMVITNDKDNIFVLGNVEFRSDKAANLFYRRCTVKPVEKVIDPTGAGDSFVAGFLHAFLQDYSIKDCVRVGTEVAAKVVTTIGCNLPKDFDVKKITDQMTKRQE